MTEQSDALVREMTYCHVTGSEHRWEPLGFTLFDGGLHPTDQCADCGAQRFPYRGGLACPADAEAGEP